MPKNKNGAINKRISRDYSLGLRAREGGYRFRVAPFPLREIGDLGYTADSLLLKQGILFSDSRRGKWC